MMAMVVTFPVVRGQPGFRESTHYFFCRINVAVSFVLVSNIAYPHHGRSAMGIAFSGALRLTDALVKVCLNITQRSPANFHQSVLCSLVYLILPLLCRSLS